MAVYERIREIGTIAAIGTPPRRILALFLTEGLLLGVGGSGARRRAVSLVVICALNVWKIHFDFGMQQGLVLVARDRARDVAVIAGVVVLMALAREPAAGVEGLAHGPGARAAPRLIDRTPHETALWLALCLVALPLPGRGDRRDADPAEGGPQPRARVLRDRTGSSPTSSPTARKKVSVLYTMKKGRDKITALFLAPASDKGRVTLRLGDNMWLYIPDVGQADPHHEPAVGDRQRLQQCRHPAHRLHRRIRRGSDRGAGRRLPAHAEGEDRRGRLRSAQDVGGQEGDPRPTRSSATRRAACSSRRCASGTSRISAAASGGPRRSRRTARCRRATSR